jgi:chromosomal replication initiator protein
MYVLREEMSISYPSIGDELGGRDHTTAMHAYNKITRELSENSRIKQELESIKQLLKSEHYEKTF